jgi:hypothetical protein
VGGRFSRFHKTIMPGLRSTPFRKRYEDTRALSAEAQLRECADYLQHPEVLITEFLESYYLVERDADPSDTLDVLETSTPELVLETFFDSLQLHISTESGKLERMFCAGGAFAPLPGGAHPALERRGLDYVGLRGGSPRLILGVAATPEESSPYSLLLRALVCFSEIAPPFQLARLREQVIRNRIELDGTFDLQIAVAESDPEEAPEKLSLQQLTRDLAEVVRDRLGEHDQFAGTLGAIECLHFPFASSEPPEILPLLWRV